MTYKEFIQNIIGTRGQWNIHDGKYFEMHHILPRCLGGLGDTKNNYFYKNSHHENCIWLYPREHFIAHKLLAEENPNNYSLITAFMMMANLNNTLISADEYEEIREKYAKSLSVRYSGTGNPFYGKHLSEDAKNKISKANLGRAYTEEEKMQQSKRLLGKNKGKKYIYNTDGVVKSVNLSELDYYLSIGWKLGNNKACKKLSEEEKNKISNATRLGMKKWKDEHPDEYLSFCENAKIKSTGRHHTEETKKKISEKNSGKNNGMYKNGLSTKEYLEAHHKQIRQVLCVELNIIFESIADASKALKIGSSHICRCALKREGFKTAGGYHWEFIYE